MKFLNHNLFTGDITVNGTTTLSTATGVTRATGDNSTHLATTAFVKAQGYATTAALAGYVPTTRTLTINGTTYDLSANRSWTISTADGYISNVQVVGSTLSFTGVGSAFSGIVDLSALNPTVRTVYETVKNVSGATILKGTPLAVVAGQTSGNVSDVVPADAADPTKMPAVFIANENIADQAEGEAVLFGNITGVDTSLYQSGTTVYVAPGGGWTATKPVWPNLIQNLGVITKQHATNGAGIVTGVGRANALPNLTAGKIWVGSANYPIESTTVHVDEVNGRVGIGTSAPSYGLDVNGSLHSTNITIADGIYHEGDTNTYIQFHAADEWRVVTGGVERLEVTNTRTTVQNVLIANDFVGIGTSIPVKTLDVVGNARVSTAYTNVGLSTITYAQLQGLPFILSDSTLDNNAGQVVTGIGFGYANEITAAIVATDKGGSAAQSLDFITGTSTALAARVSIDEIGNVGIGTTGPGYKLDLTLSSASDRFNVTQNGTLKAFIDGNGQIVSYANIVSYGNSLSGGGGTFQYGGGYSTASVGHRFKHITGSFTGSSGDQTMVEILPSINQSSTAGYTGLKINVTESAVGTGAKNLIDLQVGSSSKFLVTSAGNVGVGITLPTNKFQVANGNMSITSGYSFILADTDTNWRLGRNIIVESGNYLTGSTFQLVAANAVNEGWQFVNDDGFTALEIGGLTAARHVWVNAGNLSVGVASPQEKIHVAGNVRIDGGSTAAILETNNATAAEAGTTYRTFTTADHYAVFVDYVIYDAGRTNMRTGTFRAVWSTGDVVYTDVSTVDLGATDNVVLSAAISGANVNLIVTGPTDYTLKYNLKVIK